MINYDTIKSVYDDKLTLMQWLNKVQEALKDATAVSFNVNKTGDATLTFSIVFDDGTELETDPIVIEQGESVQSATLRNGHLILTLTNGDELDAGNMGAVSGFFINGAQHLIVQYQDGTTNDLGAIFNGNISINGNISATGNISASGTISGKTPVLTADEDKISAQKPIVEVMNGYSIAVGSVAGKTINPIYSGVCKNGNKLTIVLAFTLNKQADSAESYGLYNVYIPQAVLSKLNKIAELQNVLAAGNVMALTSYIDTGVNLHYWVSKNADNVSVAFNDASLTAGQTYFARLEITFLLSENLAE